MQARQKAADVRSGQKQTWLHTWIDCRGKAGKVQ